ncbi:MAG: transporter [Notoacmeibacter sp.]|nr:transporter [Notoacmeibacter sp.]MCC0032327.1 transporter [Brucellaceae bacterium]
MLINIPPLLGPDFLHVLRSMGHGDEIALVDANYPAAAHGRRVVRCDGLGLIEVARAVLTVMPVDEDVAHAIFRPASGRDPQRLEAMHGAIDGLCAAMVPDRPVTGLAGNAFYDRVRAAYAVVATSEPALYANMIIRKGVIRP